MAKIDQKNTKNDRKMSEKNNLCSINNILVGSIWKKKIWVKNELPVFVEKKRKKTHL